MVTEQLSNIHFLILYVVIAQYKALIMENGTGVAFSNNEEQGKLLQNSHNHYIIRLQASMSVLTVWNASKQEDTR